MKLTKMQGCGNTFVVADDYKNLIITGIEKDLSEKAQTLDETVDKENIKFAEDYVRKNIFRPDGFLFVLPANIGDFRMKYYDIDRRSGKAAKADMCGNGLRCFARYVYDNYKRIPELSIMTDAGLKHVRVDDDHVSVNLGPAMDFCKLGANMYFVNTSIGHVVYFVDKFDLTKDIEYARKEGRRIRNTLSEKLNCPEGVCVNFVKITGANSIQVATYEYGVEDITQACGTGATASAYTAAKIHGLNYPIHVTNLGGVLNISTKGKDLILSGPVEYIEEKVN